MWRLTLTDVASQLATKCNDSQQQRALLFTPFRREDKWWTLKLFLWLTAIWCNSWHDKILRAPHLLLPDEAYRLHAPYALNWIINGRRKDMSTTTFFRDLISLPGDGVGRIACCDSCQMKFNLLRRKRTCTECQMLFCSSCIAREVVPLRCRRCIVGSAVPLERQALQGLRVRDLRWMLHVRGITLHGVREKTELVDLVLQHARQHDHPLSPPSAPGEAVEDMPEEMGEDAPRVSVSASTLSNLSTSCPSLDIADGEHDSDEKHKPDMVHLDELPDEAAVENLSVLQMKRILVRNFVDFRGCCEKRDLQDKVRWLWQQRCKARKLLEEKDLDVGDEHLCKICMEGSVDCVILECGHMCTCTTCGKQLSECPICRQYVVRVVHVFRA